MGWLHRQFFLSHNGYKHDLRRRTVALYARNKTHCGVKSVVEDGIMRVFSAGGQQDRDVSGKMWARLGQEILNLLDVSGARRAVRRELLSLDRRELDDCGLTPADVTPALPDLYAQDFRVAHIAELRAA